MSYLRAAVLAAALAAGGQSLAQKYTVTVIEGWPGAAETYIGGFNTRNQLLGVSRFAGVPQKAFLYEDGAYFEFPSIGGETRPADINDHGVVVGSARDVNDVWHAFIWTEELGMRLLFDEMIVDTTAHAINNRGDIIGAIDGDPFFLKDGVLTMLPRYYGPLTYCVATDLNEDGVIVGNNLPPMSEWTYPVRWVDGQVELMDGGPAVRPSEINDNGQVVGSHFAFHIHTEWPITWINGVAHILPTLVGRGYAFGLNSRGDIAGQAVDRNWQFNTACAWIDGRFMTLQQFVNPTQWTLRSASDIDERGRITGYGWYHPTMNVRGFVLTPVNGRR